MNQYLVLQASEFQAQVEITRRKFGLEVYNEEEGDYYSPWSTKDVFSVIEHPTTDFVAIVVPPNVPFGMKGGEDWTRGKERTVGEETVKGKPGQQETIDNLWVSNKPLKDHQYMVDNGWFPEE